MSTVTAVPLRPVKRAYVVWLWIGLAFALVAGVALAKVGSVGVLTTPSGLRYKVLAEGTGPHPTDSDVALINYVGKLSDGTVFDKSQQPTPLPVAGAVPGFSEGLRLMRKGAKYRLWLPPQLAYGATPPPGSNIPPNATLQFDVELVDFIAEAKLRALQQMQMQQQGGMPGAPGGAIPGVPGGR